MPSPPPEISSRLRLGESRPPLEGEVERIAAHATSPASGDGQPPFDADWIALAAPVEHVFTHFALRLQVERADVAADMPAPPGHWWAAAGSLADEALPSVMRKVIEAACPGATKRRDEPS